MHKSLSLRLARTSIAVLAVAFLLAGCNGTFTFSKTFELADYNITDTSDFEGSFSYTINFHDKIGNDVDKLAEFRILELRLEITSAGDDFSFIDGSADYTLTIQNDNVNGGAATEIASYTGPGDSSQTLNIDCTGENLAGYAKEDSDCTIEITVNTGSGGTTDGSIDITAYVKVRVTID